RLRPRHLGTIDLTAQRRLLRRRRGERHAPGVVDYLRVDVLETAKHAQPGAARRPRDKLANTTVAPGPRRAGIENLVHVALAPGRDDPPPDSPAGRGPRSSLLLLAGRLASLPSD